MRSVGLAFVVTLLAGPAPAKLIGIAAVDGRCPCATRPSGMPWPSHDAYARCAKRAAEAVVRRRDATAEEAASKIAEAASSSCGEPARRCRYDRRPCATGLTCEHPGLSQRLLATRVGICLEAPASCTSADLPVCGTDHVTYANDCERRRARVEKRHKGRCPHPCGGPEHLACPAGEVCDCLARCGAAGEFGHCITRPTGCQPDFGPSLDVPACDGKRYPDVCAAWELGATIRSGRRRWPDYGAPYCVPVVKRPIQRREPLRLARVVPQTS